MHFILNFYLVPFGELALFIPSFIMLLQLHCIESTVTLDLACGTIVYMGQS